VPVVNVWTGTPVVVVVGAAPMPAVMMTGMDARELPLYVHVVAAMAAPVLENDAVHAADVEPARAQLMVADFPSVWRLCPREVA